MNCNSLDFVDELDYLVNGGESDEEYETIRDDDEENGGTTSKSNKERLRFASYNLIEKQYGHGLIKLNLNSSGYKKKQD